MSAYARIRVEVEVEVGKWGTKSSFDELHEQVGREGITKLKNRLKVQDDDIKIVGEPKVSFVIVKED